MRTSELMILAVSLIGALTVSTADSAMAKRPPCSSNEMAIPDERGGKLCLKKSEWAKAKKICAKNGQKNPMDCICQDADSVGACGD
jgi:hypothetical protein